MWKYYIIVFGCANDGRHGLRELFIIAVVAAKIQPIHRATDNSPTRPCLFEKRKKNLFRFILGFIIIIIIALFSTVNFFFFINTFHKTAHLALSRKRQRPR